MRNRFVRPADISVAVTDAATQLVLAAPTAPAKRVYLKIQNRGNNTAYISVDGNAATTADFALAAGDTYVWEWVPQGAIYAIRDTGNTGNLFISYQ